MAYVLELEDLIAGVTPTLVDWTNDPTDGGDITDGSISTFCTTGDKVAAGAWQQASFIWDLGAFYTAAVAGVGGGTTTAGALYTDGYGWDGANWILMPAFSTSVSLQGYIAGVLRCSKVKLAISASAPATITPNIRELHAWRL